MSLASTLVAMISSLGPTLLSRAGDVMADSGPGVPDASPASSSWASSSWAAEAAERYRLLPDAGEVNGTVNFSVVVAPRREVSFHWSYEAGKPVGGGAGFDPEAQLSLSADARDAGEILAKQVRPEVAFMRGRLKATGQGDLLLAFLRSCSDRRFDEWRERVASLAQLDLSA